MNSDIGQRTARWLSSHDTGMSSTAIVCHMVGGHCDGSYPLDVSDLGRCLRLLELIPQWKGRMHEMARYGGAWAGLASHWEEIAASMADEVGIDWSKGKAAPKTRALIDRHTRGFRMNSIAVFLRLKFDPDELKAVDDLAERQRQTREEYIQGVIAVLARDEIMAARQRQPVLGHLRLVADNTNSPGAA